MIVDKTVLVQKVKQVKNPEPWEIGKNSGMGSTLSNLQREQVPNILAKNCKGTTHLTNPRLRYLVWVLCKNQTLKQSSSVTGTNPVMGTEVWALARTQIHGLPED